MMTNGPKANSKPPATRSDGLNLTQVGGGNEVPETAQVILALILTLMLGYQAWLFAGVMCSRRLLAARRKPRITELVSIALPLAVVLFLAARSWMIAFDLGLPVMAGIAPVEVSAQPSSAPVLQR